MDSPKRKRRKKPITPPPKRRRLPRRKPRGPKKVKREPNQAIAVEPAPEPPAPWTKRPEPLVWRDGKQVPLSQVPEDKRPKLTYHERWLVSMYPRDVLFGITGTLARSLHRETAIKHYGEPND